MVILDIDSMIPEAHLLRRIKKDLFTFELQFAETQVQDKRMSK